MDGSEGGSQSVKDEELTQPWRAPRPSPFWRPVILSSKKIANEVLEVDNKIF
jgi:hypothetical protein